MYVLDRFDVLMSKMIFKKWKNIISMYFGTKSYLKSTRNHTAKHALKGGMLGLTLAILYGNNPRIFLATLTIRNQNNLILLPNLFLHPAHHYRAALLNSARFYESIQWLSNPAYDPSQFLNWIGWKSTRYDLIDQLFTWSTQLKSDLIYLIFKK